MTTVGSERFNEVGDSGKKKDGKETTLWEEILSSLLKKAGIFKIAETLRSDDETERKTAQEALKKFLKEDRSEEKQNLWKQIVSKLDNEEEDDNGVAGDLARFLKDEKDTSKPSDDEIKIASTLLSEAKRLKEKPEEREGVFSETLGLLNEVEESLEKSTKPTIEKEKARVRKAIVDLVRQAEKKENEGDKEIDREDVKNELNAWLEKMKERNSGEVEGKNLKERVIERAKKTKIVKGFQIAKDYLGKDDGERKSYLSNMSDDDYEALYVAMQEMEENGDKEFANTYRLLRAIERDYDDERMGRVVEKTIEDPSRERKAGIADEAIPTRKRRGVAKIDPEDFEKMTPEEQAKFIFDNNLMEEDKWDELSEEEQKNILNQIQADLEMSQGLDIRSRPEYMRNLNYGFYKDLEKEFKKRLEREGISFEGHIIEDYENVINSQSKDMSPRLNDGLTGRVKQLAEETIFQALLKEVRELTKQGIEGNVIYQDSRGARYLTYLATGGVNPDIKDTITKHMVLRQFGFLYRNHYINDELFTKMLSVFAQQGPEYRLFEELLRVEEFVFINKEGKEVMFDANIFDFEGILGRNASDLTKKILGIPDDVNRSYGTLNAKYTDPKMMKLVRVLTQHEMMSNKLGKNYIDDSKRFGTDKLIEEFGPELTKRLTDGGITDFALEAMSESEHYFNEAMVMMIATGRTDEVIGNASFSNDTLELPQGFPEYYMKRTPVLMAQFLWKYTPIRSPELLYGLIRMGLTSFYAMNSGEVAAHFLSLGNTAEGGLGIMNTFIKNGDKNSAEIWQKLWSRGLFDDKFVRIAKNEDGTDTVKDLFAEIVSLNEGEGQMRPLKSWSEIVKDLKQEEQDTRGKTEYDQMFEAIDWGWAIERFKYDKNLVTALSDSEKTGREKFVIFVEHLNAGVFVTTALKAKRGDYFMKYKGEYQPDYFKKGVGYLNNPDLDTLDEVADVVASLVGPDKAFDFWETNRRLLKYFVQERLNGEDYKGAKYAKGAVVMDGRKWIGGNRGEFMLPELEMIVCNIYDPDNKGRSLAEYRGYNKKYNGDFFDDISTRNGHAKGRFRSEKHFKDVRKKIREEKLMEAKWPHLKWNGEKGLGANLVYNSGVIWEVATMKKVVDWLARDILGLTPALFWDWLISNTEKDISGLWKYFNS